MASIVLVWEMGTDLGHVSRLDSLASHLSRCGHSVTAIFSDLNYIKHLYPTPHSAPYRIQQGPGWTDRRLRLSRSPANLSEVLLSVGFYQPQTIADKLVQWQALFSQLQADIIIYDYAPTALLATRKIPCHKINLSDPFSNPPACSPLPLFDRYAKVSEANLAISERKLVSCINQATHKTGLADIEYAHELFAADKTFLLSIPELDPFADLRGSEKYIGPFTNQQAGTLPLTWSRFPEKKVFAYLKPTWPSLEAFLEATSKLPIQARFFIPGAPDTLVKRYQKTNFEIVTTPYDLRELKDCDLVVCHGGHSTLLQSTLSGTPTLLIPLQQEQQSIALKAVDSALALTLAHDIASSEVISSYIEDLLLNEHVRQRAKHCAQHYKQQFSAPALEVVTKYAESLS